MTDFVKRLKAVVVENRLKEDIGDDDAPSSTYKAFQGVARRRYSFGWVSAARDNDEVRLLHPRQSGHSVHLYKNGTWEHKIDNQVAARGRAEDLSRHLERFHRRQAEDRGEEIRRRLLETKTPTPDEAEHRAVHHLAKQTYHSHMATHALEKSLTAQRAGDERAEQMWLKKHDYHSHKADRHGDAYEAAENRFGSMTGNAPISKQSLNRMQYPDDPVHEADLKVVARGEPDPDDITLRYFHGNTGSKAYIRQHGKWTKVKEYDEKLPNWRVQGPKQDWFKRVKEVGLKPKLGDDLREDKQDK